VDNFIEESKLKAKIIKGENNNPYEYVFLVKENEEFLNSYK